jgi:toxin ParE1/3/4
MFSPASKNEYGRSKMKTYSVVFDISAGEDLVDIYKYVATNESIERADKLYLSLRSACRGLKTLPYRGHIPPELFEVGVVEYRKIRCKPYRIFHSIEDNRVKVHCILDGRRDIQTVLQERALR